MLHVQFKSYEVLKISAKVWACCQPLPMHQNLPKTAQNYLKLPKTTKIRPKTISSRNFEIPPEIEILVFFKKETSIYRGDINRKHVHTVWIFNTRIFHMPFSMSKNGLCM
jgi:hypothetical protein